MEDTRNVLDKYKGLSEEEIRKDVKENSFPFAFCMQQIQGDFNISNVLRSGNAFGVREAFYFGNKKWDRRGAVGVHHYTPFTYLKTLDDLIALKEKYVFVAIEQTSRAVEITDFEWPDNTLMIFGEESCGISKEVLAISDQEVIIPQFGSVRSLNAASAASIAMWDYVSKRLKKNG